MTMPIELQYDNMDAVPEAFRAEPVFKELFTTAADGKIVLSGVTGMKTQKDVSTVQEALRKEREDHAKARDALKPWGDLNATETLAQLDRIKELEAAAGGKLDEAKLNELVEGRLSQKTGPLQRQIDALTGDKTKVEQERDALKAQLETRDRNDAVRSVATEAKVLQTAIPDMEMAASVMLEKDADGNLVTKSGINGLTPGLSVKEWAKEMQKLRPHWWPESEGGGARGGGGGGGLSGNNPFTAEHWSLTEQGKFLQTNGRDATDKLAKAAGTTIGGPKPAPKK
jgi:hypothetical protein